VVTRQGVIGGSGGSAGAAHLTRPVVGLAFH